MGMLLKQRIDDEWELPEIQGMEEAKSNRLRVLLNFPFYFYENNLIDDFMKNVQEMKTIMKQQMARMAPMVRMAPMAPMVRIRKKYGKESENVNGSMF